MKMFDIKEMSPFAHGKNMNVLYNADEFKARIVELPPGGEIPICEMASYVIFYVVEGSADITCNQEKAIVSEGQCVICEPATISMRSIDGAKILGVQITAMKGV